MGRDRPAGDQGTAGHHEEGQEGAAPPLRLAAASGRRGPQGLCRGAQPNEQPGNAQQHGVSAMRTVWRRRVGGNGPTREGVSARSNV